MDGASGGFLAPFVEPDLVWDFRLPRVKSINTSGHKFGLAPLGVGWIVWRDAADLPEDLIFQVNYLGGDMPTFALNFSRPGGQVVAQYYNFLRLGREGYRKIHEAGYQTAQFLADEIAAMGPFELIHDGRGGIPGLAWKLREDRRAPVHAVRSRRSPARHRAGRCRPTRCRRTGRTWPSSGSSSATASAATWRACCSTTTGGRSGTSTPTRAPSRSTGRGERVPPLSPALAVDALSARG